MTARIAESQDSSREATVSNGKPNALTAADREALADLPKTEWFDVRFAPIARPMYRCDRLEAAGMLERRVRDLKIVNEHVSYRVEYRRKPGAATEG